MEAEVAEKRHRKRDSENGFSVYTVVVSEKQAFMKKGASCIIKSVDVEN